MLLRNVRIDDGEPVQVTVEGGLITAIGPLTTGATGRGPGPGPDIGIGRLGPGPGEIVECGGRPLLPGLWDAHVHLAQWAAARRRVDLTGTGSAREAADVMARAADLTPRGEPLIGFGFRDALWPDPMAPELLEWPGRPPRVVALISNDLHTAWLNREALAALGLAGHPDGVLREEPVLDAAARLGRATPEVLDRWVREAVREAARRGVTGVMDFEYADNPADWTRRAAAWPGGLPLRVAATVYPDALEKAIAAGRRTGEPVPGTGGLLTTGPLKLFVDGSLNTRTALCHEPYPATGGHGTLQSGPEELVALMTRAAAHGIRSAVHAIGDRAGTIALDAFDRVPGPGRIEHAQLVDRRDLPRYARPGLVLGVQPAHAVDDRDVADRHWKGRTDRAFAYAELLRAGARLEFGSDAPVSPLDPWVGISAAVHRTGADGRPSWHPEQAVTLGQALAASVRTGVAVGAPADLVIADADPAAAGGPAALAATPVAGTLVGGRWTHRDGL